jgi:hypothetical protein
MTKPTAKPSSRLITNFSKGVVLAGLALGACSSNNNPAPQTNSPLQTLALPPRPLDPAATVTEDSTGLITYRGESFYDCQRVGRIAAKANGTDTYVECDLAILSIKELLRFTPDGKIHSVRPEGT